RAEREKQHHGDDPSTAHWKPPHPRRARQRATAAGLTTWAGGSNSGAVALGRVARTVKGFIDMAENVSPGTRARRWGAKYRASSRWGKISAMTMLERAEAAERAMSEELDRAIVKSAIYTSGDRDPRQPAPPRTPGKKVMMGHDPRLPKMPDKPTLLDFFKLRFGPANHLMQSARLAQKNGIPEKLVLAC